MLNFNAPTVRINDAEDGLVKRRVRELEGQASTASKSRTSTSMGWLLRQSFVGSSMYTARNEDSKARSWPQSEVERPKSVFVISPAASSTNKSHDSRRSSIDTSELRYTADRRSLTDIWTRMGDIDQFTLSAQADKRHSATTDATAGSETGSEDDNSRAELTAGHKRANNIDSGYAWLILIVVFWINATIFGAAEVYGLIYEKSTRNGYRSRTESALPFSTMGAVQNMAGPVCGCILALTSSWRITVGFGSLLVTTGHLLAFLFSESKNGQFLSMGLITGFGLGFITISLFQVTNAYFHKYRRLASAIGLSGAAFGTLIISPICHHLLDHHHGTRMAYLALGLMIAPNVLLAMLLKPQTKQAATTGCCGGGGEGEKQQVAAGDSQESMETSESSSADSSSCSSLPDEQQAQKQQQQQQMRQLNVQWDQCDQREDTSEIDAITLIKLVFVNPYFHLLWPTQLLFHWFEFIISLITVDYVTDKNMSTDEASFLVPIWAFGQVCGHILFGLTIDLRIVTFRTWNIICYLSLATLVYSTRFAADLTDLEDEGLIFVAAPVFLTSMFVCLWHVLLHELVQHYIEESLQPLSLGISSFMCSFFLLPRAHFIGYYYGRMHSYCCMLFLFTYIGLGLALIWLFVPLIYKYVKYLRKEIVKSSQEIQARYPKYCATWKEASGHPSLHTQIKTPPG